VTVSKPDVKALSPDVYKYLRSQARCRPEQIVEITKYPRDAHNNVQFSLSQSIGDCRLNHDRRISWVCLFPHDRRQSSTTNFPDLVQLYLRPPVTKYEEVALLDSSSRHSFSFAAQGKTNAVITRLKEEAAKLGANGILLNGVSDQAAASVNTGFGSTTAAGNTATGFGFGTSGTVFIKSGSGLAIYVEPDQVASR
jgi:hypothetical protein